MSAWNPRGTPSWPDWKQAAPGTRVRHVRTGHEGTFVKVGNVRSKNSHAVVDWDPKRPGWPVARGAVVSPAFDLRPIAEEPDDAA